MGLWQRFKKRQRSEPDLDDAQTSETFEAATDRYFERLAAQGIPSPEDWRNPKPKPATTADVARERRWLRLAQPKFIARESTAEPCRLAGRA